MHFGALRGYVFFGEVSGKQERGIQKSTPREDWSSLLCPRPRRPRPDIPSGVGWLIRPKKDTPNDTPHFGSSHRKSKWTWTKADARNGIYGKNCPGDNLYVMDPEAYVGFSSRGQT